MQCAEVRPKEGRRRRPEQKEVEILEGYPLPIRSMRNSIEQYSRRIPCDLKNIELESPPIIDRYDIHKSSMVLTHFDL
jgi:hypothetical protein